MVEPQLLYIKDIYFHMFFSFLRIVAIFSKLFYPLPSGNCVTNIKGF